MSFSADEETIRALCEENDYETLLNTPGFKLAFLNLMQRLRKQTEFDEEDSALFQCYEKFKSLIKEKKGESPEDERRRRQQEEIAEVERWSREYQKKQAEIRAKEKKEQEEARLKKEKARITAKARPLYRVCTIEKDDPRYELTEEEEYYYELHAEKRLHPLLYNIIYQLDKIGYLKTAEGLKKCYKEETGKDYDTVRAEYIAKIRQMFSRKDEEEQEEE